MPIVQINQVEQNQVQEKQNHNGSGRKSSRRGPLFVVGMWRSGTSLSYALLNQHSEIALLYEGDLPLLWPLFLGGKGRRDWPERWEFWNSGASRHQIDIESLPRDAASVREACDAVWDRYGSASIHGCKSPNYYDMLPSLAEQFPGARFLIIWRNPADVLRSVVRASQGDSFFAKRGMVLRALRGCHEMKLGHDWLVAHGVPVHTVQYEALVKDAAGVMQEVCAFLDIKFDPRMASLEDADRSAIYEGGHHEKVKTERIAAARPKRETLPADVLGKVERYLSYWHSEYDGQWPATPLPSGKAPPAWFALERLWDSIAYRTLRIFDWMVVFLYCFAPIGLLRGYRSWRGRKPETGTPAKAGTAEEDKSPAPVLVPAGRERKPLPSHPVVLDQSREVTQGQGTGVSR